MDIEPPGNESTKESSMKFYDYDLICYKFSQVSIEQFSTLLKQSLNEEENYLKSLMHLYSYNSQTMKLLKYSQLIYSKYVI